MPFVKLILDLGIEIIEFGFWFAVSKEGQTGMFSALSYPETGTNFIRDMSKSETFCLPDRSDTARTKSNSLYSVD